IKQTETVAGVKLRSASSTNTPDYLLEITSEQNQQPTSKALLLYIDNASNDYVPAEDSYKLFSENSLAHVLVYLRSSDGYALDINSIGNLEQAIPLGIRTNQKGQIRLKFEGTDKFLDKANVFLHDTKANKVTNMSLYKEYTFNKDEDDLYLENRFYITFNNGSPTGIKGLESASVSIQNPAPQTLQILSNADNPLGHVQITDLQGKILVSKDVQATSYIYPVKIPGLYIVRVTRKESVEVKKVIIK
ncbi:MAG: T9SS type A sorting domain-containing protein, partial [Candidatus Symbiothrix sp.]|nr:T9SS type A sorting domain-containing protein [Candidatus Symbiothrix sp.]